MRLLQHGLSSSHAALVFQSACGKCTQFCLHDARFQIGGEISGYEAAALAFRRQPGLDGLCSGSAGGELLQIQAGTTQVDVEQRLALDNGLAFLDMNGGDDAAFQMLNRLNAIRRDDLAARDHDVLNRVEQSHQYQHTHGGGNHLAVASQALQQWRAGGCRWRDEGRAN
ncbi:hypothetical protein D3C72_1819550 [compost metagenome]